VFNIRSRYAKLEPYQVVDHRDRTVLVVPVPDAPSQSLLGIHLRKQGQRVDHLAYRYLDDAAGFWRICELNDVMLAETLSEAREVQIPRKEG
jgi:hypothetical protein